MNGKQVNTNRSSMVRLDPELRKQLKIIAANESCTIKSLVEWCVIDFIASRNSKVEKGQSNG